MQQSMYCNYSFIVRSSFHSRNNIKSNLSNKFIKKQKQKNTVEISEILLLSILVQRKVIHSWF